MFRYVLAANMLLLSLTGPNPCCCTLYRLVAVTTSWARTGGHSEVHGLSCCQQQFSDELDPQQSDAQPCQELPASKGPTKRCKCDKSFCNPIPSQSITFTFDLNRTWSDDLTLNLATSLMVELGDFSAIDVPPNGTPPAPRSGRDTRVALHSWQC